MATKNASKTIKRTAKKRVAPKKRMAPKKVARAPRKLTAKKKLTPQEKKPSWAPSIRPEMQSVMEKLASYNAPPLETLSPERARQNPTPADAVRDLIAENNIKVPVPKVVVTNQHIAVSEGEIEVRIYTPAKKKKEYPGILYIHGGGWVIATIDTYDASASAMAEQNEAVVVSVEYRKGPEHKFPAAHTDSFDAYRWMLKHSESLKINPKRVALVGESAGGNLAINVAIMARDHKKVELPVAQVLVYPISQSNMNTESYKKNENAKPLNKAMMSWFVKYALPSESAASDPRVDLTKADLNGLPPTTIITAEYDPLLTDGEILRDFLADAGVNVKYKMYKGVTHEFFGMAAVVPEAKEAQELATKNLSKYLKK
ncbi:MAG: alpha/beta hydrolase [Cyclobacteriaceae bacterium]|nr:alpha/beta hydrolase [Cyclobacteriaceae bacterium]